jgi:hypothetical protein
MRECFIHHGQGVIARAGMVSGTGRHRSTSDSYAANRRPRYSASRPGDHRWLLRHVNGLNGPASIERSIVNGRIRDGPDARHARDNRRTGLPALTVLAPNPAHRLPHSLQRSNNSNGANRWTQSILYHAPRRALHPKSRHSHPHPPQGGSHHRRTHHPPGRERSGEVALSPTTTIKGVRSIPLPGRWPDGSGDGLVLHSCAQVEAVN